MPNRNIGRSEFVDRLLSDIRALPAKASSSLLESFAQAILRRADNRYLYRHRLTTLGAQLSDSLKWVTACPTQSKPLIRAFLPKDAEHGYSLEGRVIETLMPDQPFIFDTLKLYMRRHGITVHNSLNVIFPVVRDENGTITSINVPAENAQKYSYTRWYVDWPESMTAEAVAAGIQLRLETSQAMVGDFHRMVRALKELANDFDYLAKESPKHGQDCTEVRDFLNWLSDDNFVFMGVSFYTIGPDGKAKVDRSRGLGSVRDNPEPSGRSTSQTLEFLSRHKDIVWPLARVRKSPYESLVHRAGKIDEVLVCTFDDNCQARGGIVVHGMFTFKGLGEQGSAIPILRRKVKRIVDAQAPVIGSYEYKGLLSAFDALPVEYLFEAPQQVIEDLLQLSIKADASGEIQSSVVLNDDTQSAYAFVVLQKEHYSDELRQTLELMLTRELKATYVDHRIHLGKFGTVALHFYLTGDSAIDAAGLPRVEAELVELGTPWKMQVRQKLEDAFGEEAGMRLFERYRDAFSDGYIEAVPAPEAIVDVQHLDSLHGDTAQGPRFALLPSTIAKDEALLRIYSIGEMLLTDILPVVDNFGVVVIEQYAFDVMPQDAPVMTVNTLRIERGEYDAHAQRETLIGGLRSVFGRRMRSDRLNRMLLAAKLNWREVDLLRAYYEYSRQLGLAFNPEMFQRVMIRHATFVSKLLALFRLRFDPDMVDDDRRKVEVERIGSDLASYLDGVASFDEDRILRTFLNLIDATLRTNFFVTRESGEHLISFKVRSSKVLEMPDPRPMFEIFVHHARVDGIHLRGGKVARGGLRWSDRHDDFRSEVLGLMATQMLKNTLIVPVGAKGGFVLNERHDDYASARKAADEVYKLFIRGLLELTDNNVGDKVVPPPRVVRYDEDDPYLVVAADKGTAHLSDTANGLAAEFDFWLGDAFASGGSVGYDHKEKGITARGAWVCVQRQFAEMGVDPEKDPITCVGIGDMSGDVFGNGLLCSSSMKLIAAFNHNHIFVDPTPDPATSFAERKRMFELGRSQWTDYDKSTLSKGGGIYDRGAKAINLSPEACAALDLPQAQISGPELIKAILRAEVDLLWNGGIGTYVKASNESHHDVEDKDNDRVRVDATELRCKVIGEGGNLGMTMRSRVEYSLRGGRCFMDAVDNSGGVDLSDHEVNLKTCLAPVVRDGKLSGEARNALLIKIGDEVCDLVLQDSYLMALGLSLDKMRSEQNPWMFFRALDYLRSEVPFSRRVARLPRGVEAFEHREQRRLGLMRPELSKLMSYTKQVAYRTLLVEPIGTKAEMEPFLVEYFPKVISDKYRDAMNGHELFNEIAATVQVNHVTSWAGVTFLPLMLASTQRSIQEIYAAYFVVERLIGARALREKVLASAGTRTDARYEGLLAIEGAIVEGIMSLLHTRDEKASLAWLADTAPMGKAVKAIAKAGHHLPAASVQQLEQREVAFGELGFDKKLSAELALLPLQQHAVVIGAIANDLGLPAEAVAPVYLAAGEKVGILPLIETIVRQVYRDTWDYTAILSIRKSLYQSLDALTRQLATQALAGSSKKKGAAVKPAEIEHAVSSVASLAKMGDAIRDLLHDRVPVSATFVMSEQLRDRIARF